MQWWRAAVDLTHNLAVGEHILLETTAYRHDIDRTWERLNQFRDGTQFLDVLTRPTTPPLDSYYQVLTGQQDSPSASGGTGAQDLMVTSNRRRYVVMGIQTRLRADFDTGKVHHEIESGLRYHYDSVDRFQPEQGYSMQNTQLVWDGLTYSDNPDLLSRRQQGASTGIGGLPHVRHRSRRARRSNPVFESSTSAHSSKTRRARLNAGTIREDPQLVFLPGIGLQYTILEGFAALAGVHRGFSAVTPGNRTLADPELSINYEAGFRYVTKDSAGFGEVIGFFNDYSNITSECTLSAGCNPDLVNQQFNNGRAFIGGVEVLGGYTVPLPRALMMPVRVSYTFTNATYRSTFQSSDPTLGDVEKGDPIPYVPAHVLNAQLGFERSFWAVYLVGNYFGKMGEGVRRPSAPAGHRSILRHGRGRAGPLRSRRGVRPASEHHEYAGHRRAPPVRGSPDRTAFGPGRTSGQLLSTWNNYLCKLPPQRRRKSGGGLLKMIINVKVAYDARPLWQLPDPIPDDARRLFRCARQRTCVRGAQCGDPGHRVYDD